MVSARGSIRRAALASVAVACLAVTAACGGGTEPGSAAASSGSTSDARLAEAAKVVEQASQDKSQWEGPTSAPAPVSGKTIGIVPCGMVVEGCAREARGTEAAAKAIGWRPVIADGEANPQAIQRAVTSLINRKVDAIVLNSVNAQDIGAQLEAAKKAGILVIATFAEDPKPYGGLGTVNIDDEAAGRALAAYAATNGGGGVLLFTQNESPAVAARAVGFRAAAKEFGGLKILEDQSIPNNQLGEPEQQLMSSLMQRHPKGTVSWVVAGFDFMLTPLVNAAQRAGRTEIKGMAADGNQENLNFIRNDAGQAAVIGYPLEWAGWAAVDGLNRAFQDQPLVDEGVRFKLLTKDNLPPENSSYVGDLDYEAKYRELWGR
jgi:ribose transport system substrate-binding protein